MMNQDRYSRVLSKLAEKNVEQMLVTDTYAIFWLTGEWIHPGERFLGLLISAHKEPVIFVNQLLEVSDRIGMRIVWFSDTDNIFPLLAEEIDPELTLGVDKVLQSRFLIPMIDNKLAKSFVNSSEAIDFARANKDEEEKELMRKCSLINDQAMAKFKALVHEGVTEIEVAEKTREIYKSLGASLYSFTPIVSFGKNAADPHHSPDNTVLKEGDCVLFDIGCVTDNYCSDMTRTFYFRKAPDERVEKIYNLVRKANEAAEAMIKPGVPLCEIDAVARNIITEAGYGPNFNHRLGHFIGLEVHEFGDVSSANSRVAEVGNVFSIEPGIYLSGDTGVRIEDLVIVTEDGCEVLNHYSKDIEIIK